MIVKELTLPMFTDAVPRRLRFWLLLLFAFIYQFSDGFYMATSTHVAGELSLQNSDIMFCAYVSFIGLTMLFPLLFPIKLGLGEKRNIIISASGLVVCNLLLMYVTWLPALVIICFMAGIFRIWGTFSCMSTIMQGITPSFNPGHFLSVMFLLVLGTIQLSGFVSAYIVHYSSWQFMHLLGIALQLFILLTAIIIMRNLPTKDGVLLGIDWGGFILWSIFLISIVYVALYGEQLEWYSSPYIRGATGSACIALALNIALIIHHPNPYINIKAFMSHNLWHILILFFVLCFMSCSQTVLQNIFLNRILHFDSLNNVTLNIWTLVGIIIGAYISYLTLVKLQWKHVNVMSTGIIFTTLYAASMIPLMSPQTSLETMYLPSILRGIGMCLVYVSLTAYCEHAGNFKYFFQVLCLLGFIRTGIASPLSSAYYQHTFAQLIGSNNNLLGSTIDTQTWSFMTHNEIINSVIQSSMLCSLRDMFAMTAIVGFITILLILASRYRNYIKSKIYFIVKRSC